MSQSLPRQFGKYLLLEKIAMGGMAEVFKARISGDHGFEKTVIIKKIYPHLQHQDELVASFIDEAKIAALLQHESIVQIYDFGRVDDSYFIAMEYLEGYNLKTILDASRAKNSPIDLEAALYITSRLCAGMHYAHNLSDRNGNPLNIVHRDVSPPNIMITAEGQVKIIDFGIAKAAIQNKATQLGIIKGKVAYMSPEQAEGKAIDHRSDIFAIGNLFYEMVTGFPVYDGETMTILSKARDGAYRSLDETCPDMPGSIRAIIHRALEKKPERRYPSAMDMMTDIENSSVALGLYPSGHRLSLYMKELFDPKVTLPDRKRPTVQPYRDGRPPEGTTPNDTGGADEEPYEATVSLKVDNYWHRNRHKIAAGAAALAAILFFLVFALRKEDPSPSPPARASVQNLQETSEAAFSPTPQTQTPPEFPALTALKEKRYQDAVAQFEELFNRKPGQKESLALPYVEALLGAAAEKTETDTGLAKILLNKVIDRDPENIKAHFQLGLIYVKTGDYVGAISSYLKVIDLDEMSADAYFNLGYVYALNKAYFDAESVYQNVVKLKPPYLDEALFNLAVVQARLGKPDEARSNLELALVQNPGNTMAKDYLTKLESIEEGIR